MVPLLLPALAGGLSLATVLAAARQWEAAAWRGRLVAFRMRIPTGLSSEELARWLASVAALTHAPRGALLPSPPLVVEVTATTAGLDYQLLVPARLQDAVLSSIGAVLSGVRVEPLDHPPSPPVVIAKNPVARPGVYRMAAGLRLAGRHRQLAIERADASSRTLAAALQPLGRGERITWQWIITGAGTPPPISSKGIQATDLPWWLEEQAPADADGIRAARLKQRRPLLHATARLVVEAPSRARAHGLFGRAWGAVRLLNVPGSRLVRDYWPAWLVTWQARIRWLPSFGWPLRLNAAELAGLMPWPVGEDPLPGLPAAITRQVPPPVDLSTSGTVLADATYPGNSQPLRLAAGDRLMHVALLGPTGTGKSTLLVNMALQDIADGDGLALLDPKADMAGDLLDRIPKRRWDDVVVINPADTGRPVGFNPLASDGSEQGRELAVDHVLHVFREVWASFWGPRTEAVLRSGLLTLTAARAADGSAFTVCELPRLLNDDAFRAWLSCNPALPGSVREFWDWFNALSVGERTQVVGPVMNKLTALTQRTPLRLILGQSQGIDLAQAIRDKRLLILPLSRGLVGAETAALLASLMVASLWQAILGRVRTAQSDRQPYWLFIDEASEVVRLPVDLTDLMAEARGLGVGLTLATQHLSQLPTEVRRALLATVRSQVIFQVESDDARLLERSFGPTLTETDLRSLPAHEVAMRLAVGGQTSRPMTGKTRPLPPSLGSGARLRTFSRQGHGIDRADVEAGLKRRSQVPEQFRAPGRPVGQRPARGKRS
jgi:hypothetical protein